MATLKGEIISHYVEMVIGRWYLGPLFLEARNFVTMGNSADSAGIWPQIPQGSQLGKPILHSSISRHWIIQHQLYLIYSVPCENVKARHGGWHWQLDEGPEGLAQDLVTVRDRKSVV